MFGIGACAKGAGGGFAPGHNPFMSMMQERAGACSGPAAVLKDLNLTDDQLEQVAALKAEGLGHCVQVKAALCGQIKLLADELTKDKIDKARVNEIVQQIKAEKSKMGDSVIERKSLLLPTLLTPEQRRKLRLAAIKRFLGFDDLLGSES